MLLLLLLAGCANYTINKLDLVEQLRATQNQTKENTIYVFVMPIAVLPVTTYYANSIEKILVRDKDGELLWLYPDRNTNLECKMFNGKVEKAYFDTIMLKGNSIWGLRSRLLNIEKEIPIDSIESITIFTEFAKTEKYIK